MRLQSAIFDMDGTLLDSMSTWNKLGSALIRRLGREPEADLDEKLRVMSLKEGAAYCVEHYHLPLSVDKTIEQMNEVMKDFYCTNVEAKAGVERMLSVLKMQGVWMYIATATDRPLAEAALKHTGLSDYFRGIVTCGEAGCGKENPKIYEMALRRLGSRKEDTVLFEDALFAIRTAKKAGFRVAGVYDPSEPKQDAVKAEADYYIRSFEDWTKVDA